MIAHVKYLPHVLLLAGGLALAGCGGSSDSGNGNGNGNGNGDGNNYDCADGTKTKDAAACLKKIQDAKDEEAKMEEAAKKAAADARTLYAVLGGIISASDTIATSKPASTIPDADKFMQSITPKEGEKLLDLDVGDSGLTKIEEGEPYEGYYSIANANLGEVKADVFSGAELNDHSSITFSTTGTYMGVSGTIRCAETEDTVCTSKDGKITTASAGTWYFKPTSRDARIAGAKFEWGWSLGRTTDDAKAVNAITRFIVPPADTDSSALNGLGAGTASYEGDATGQYSTTGDSGKFEAKASLTATFAAGAGTNEDKIEGKIHTFVGADGESRAWKDIELKEGYLNATGNLADNAGTDARGKISWDGSETGSWDVKAYNGDADTIPNIVTGDFKAENQGSRIAGVFGAEKE